MSTILDALRKAKEHPPKNVVEAGREVLSEHTHDYLATVSPSSGRQVLVLKVLVGVCLLLILGLGAVVAGLMFGNRPAPAPASAEPGIQQASASMPSRASDDERVLRVKVQRPLTVKVPTAVPAQPTAAPQPVTASAPTAPPAAPTAAAEKPTAAPSPAASKALAGMRVEGIVWDPRSPMAMVDGKLLKVGSRIGPAEVVRIERDSVVLRVDGQEYVLGH